MHIDHLITDAASRDRLGPAGAAATAAALHRTGDCQTCNERLGVERPVLCVDELDDHIAWATLHHRRCREPGWSRTAAMLPAGTSLTYTVSYWLLALEGHGDLPVLALNPGLEMVSLGRARAGWMPQVRWSFVMEGLAPPRRGEPFPAVESISARVSTQGHLSVVLADGQQYPSPPKWPTTPPDIIESARARSSIVLLVTHGVDTRRVHDVHGCQAMFNDPLTVAGEVAPSG